MIITGKSTSAGTHYLRAWSSGQIYNGLAFENYLLASYATYPIVATSAGLGIFTGTAPVGSDFVELVTQAGGSPAATDLVAWVVEVPASETGGGARTIVLTVRDETAVVAGARVRMTKGSESYTDTTGVAGTVTFNVDDGDWVIAITYPAKTFAGATLTVAADDTQTYTMTTTVITAPAEPDTVTAYFIALDEDYVAVSGVEFEYILVATDDTDGISLPRDTKTATSAAVTGLVELTLPVSCTAKVRRMTAAGAGGPWREITIGTDATQELPQVLGRLA